MGYSFDGPTKKVNLTTGTTSADIDDLYSRWYDWWVLSDNSKYPLALRNVGGDEVSDIKDLGITFFLTNGWRIVPQDADHRLELNGNLYTDPAGFSPIDTVPGRSIIVEYSVSNLVDSTLAQMAEIQYASFNGGVTVDLLSSNTGTIYPVGTAQAPVNNFADGLLIGAPYGFDTFFVVGNALVDSSNDFDDMSFYGASAKKSLLTMHTSASLIGCELYEATVTGILDGDCTIIECTIITLNYINGTIKRCLLEDGTITLGGGAEAHIIDCKSGVAGTGIPTIDMGGSGQELSIRNYYGGIKLINKTGPESVSIDMSSGQVVLDDTVTNGTIVVRGVGKLVDTSGNHIHGTTWNGCTIVNELVNRYVEELHTVQGLDVNNPMTVTPTSRVAGDISQVISGDGETTTTVTRQ